jgi:cytochrome o ubiquinol oxidase operon protein cyoD
MTDHASNPLAHPEVQQASSGRYFAGFLASALLMLGALVLTERKNLTYVPFSEVVLGLLLLALISQSLLFFGLNLSREQIWKSISLTLAIPLFVISIGFTVLVFNSLYAQTMLPSDPMSMQPTLLQ